MNLNGPNTQARKRGNISTQNLLIKRLGIKLTTSLKTLTQLVCCHPSHLLVMAMEVFSKLIQRAVQKRGFVLDDLM